MQGVLAQPADIGGAWNADPGNAGPGNAGIPAGPPPTATANPGNAGPPPTATANPGNANPGNAGVPAGPPPTATANPGNANPGNAGIPAGPPPTATANPGNAGVPAGPPPTGNADPKDWYSRGYLPHLDQPGLVQAITFRLHDSVPAHVVEQWQQELRWAENLPPNDRRTVALHRLIAADEDAGHGACWLCDERLATLVENALLFFDGERYRLIAWCVMPNHVHVLIETWPGFPLRHFLHSWKSFTAQQANKLLGRAGPFWAREYYDRFIRNDRHFRQAVDYIEGNPVKAGLAPVAEAWRFGSAARTSGGG